MVDASAGGVGRAVAAGHSAAGRHTRSLAGCWQAFCNPYLKPLSIDPGSWKVLAHHRPDLPGELAGYLDDQWQVPANGFAPVVTKARIGLLVFPTYEAGATTSCERLSPASVVAAATACTFGPDGRSIGQDRIRALAAMAAAVPAYSLVSGDLEQACAAVIDRLPRA